MAYENVITVNGSASVLSRQITIDREVAGVMLTPLIRLLAPLTGLLSTILMPSGFTYSVAGNVVTLQIPQNMAKGKYEISLPSVTGKYVVASFTIEMFPSDGARDD